MGKYSQNAKTTAKLITYMILSYLTAAISVILVMVLQPQDSLQNVLNVLLSTNACFIVTTGLGIKKDNCSTNLLQSTSDIPYVSIIVGLCISVALTVCLQTTDKIPPAMYIVGFILSFSVCGYLAWAYAKESLMKDEIVEKYQREEMERRVQEMIAAKEESSFSIAGKDYKL